MPISLYHGPASPKKQELLKKKLFEHKNKAVLLVPDESWLHYCCTNFPDITAASWDSFLHHDFPQDTVFFLAYFYPLNPDQLELLAKIKATQSQTHLHIFYDEHFDQENKSLQKTYEELGHLSDESEYIESESLPSPKVLEFSNPFDEIFGIVESIKKNRAAHPGMQIIILAPNENYQGPITRLLSRQKIPDIRIITDTIKWGYAFDRKTYLPGWSLESFPQILIEKTRQILVANSLLVITRPELDFKNKPTTPIEKNIFNSDIEKQHAPQNTDKRKVQSHHDYFKTKKKHFSISEIQEYLNCPYRYYATYHLGLKSSATQDLQPGRDVQGILVHHVLCRLIKENEAEYLEGLEYESYRKKLAKKLSLIIDEEFRNDDRLKNCNSHLVKFYSQRVYKTILSLMEIEAENFKKNLKATVPKYCEWDFGKLEKDSLKIQTDVGTIQIRGRIDRVDVNHTHKNFAVIDYKTGTLPTQAELKSAKTVQLPLYLMAVKATLFPSYKPAGAYYYALYENNIKGFTIADSVDAKLLSKQANLSPESWHELEMKIKEQVNHAVTNICKGHFEPNPQKEDICENCDFRKICGYHYSNL